MWMIMAEINAMLAWTNKTNYKKNILEWVQGYINQVMILLNPKTTYQYYFLLALVVQ